MATPVGFDPSYNATTTGPYTLGQVLEYNGRSFRFVKNAADAAIADGVVCVKTTTSNVVTGASRATALLGATTLGSPCAGVGIGAISTGNYGFILIFGRHTNVLGVATVTAGRLQRCSTTADSGDNVSNAYDSSFGEAITALSGARYTVDVRCL